MGELRRRCSSCGESYAEGVIFCPRDGSALSARASDSGPDPYLGQTLQGTFRVEALIGTGAVARVYRAHQLGVERKVALKIMHAELASNELLEGRFRREARIAGALCHPNLLSVFLLSDFEHEGLRIPFLALEYLDGMSLRSALAALGALPTSRALHVLLQIADAVGEAHQRGIVHRDLKPENVMLVQRGSDRDFVKVLDFGVARAAGLSAEEYPSLATRAGAILGSARYVAPECAAGGPASPASDVYALATLAYECLSGSTPFDGDNAVQILIQQQSSAPAPLRGTRRGAAVPVSIAQTIERNLEKASEARASDAHAFARQLMAAAENAGSSARLDSRTERGHAVSPENRPPTRLIGAPQVHVGAAPRAPARSTKGATHRALFVLLCFVLGAGAALGIAAKLGAFAERLGPAQGDSKAGAR